jgi:hypothetical protein
VDLDRLVDELRSVPIPAGAMDRTIKAVQASGSKSRVWPVTVGVAALVVVLAMLPFREEDQGWAAAVRAFRSAKSVHLQFNNRFNSCEAWESGEMFRKLGRNDELRYNGRRLGHRSGTLWSVRTVRPDKLEMRAIKFQDLASFDEALNQIGTKNLTPLEETVGAKRYRAYRFRLGSVSLLNDPYASGSSDPRDRWPKNGHIGFNVVTAFVDPGPNRIVRLERHLEFDPGVPADTRRIGGSDDFVATIDYPATLPEDIFETPANAFDEKDSKRKVATALRGSLGTATVADQKISLKAVLFDGRGIYAIWDGCPCDLNAPQRFAVNGKVLGPALDFRCFCTNKFRMPKLGTTPHSGMGEATQGPIPGRVDLRLPVFAPDRNRPVFDRNHHRVGYFSKCVGWASFRNVPVTPILMLRFGYYQTEFGQAFDLN